jgi:hypothetical protein
MTLPDQAVLILTYSVWHRDQVVASPRLTIISESGEVVRVA